MEHVTDLELETLVRQQYTRMAASFIPVPFSFAGDDSKYPVKEDEIKRYYGEHRELFAEAPSRSSDYVFSLSHLPHKTALPHSRSLHQFAQGLPQPATTQIL